MKLNDIKYHDIWVAWRIIYGISLPSNIYGDYRRPSTLPTRPNSTKWGLISDSTHTREHLEIPLMLSDSSLQSIRGLLLLPPVQPPLPSQLVLNELLNKCHQRWLRTIRTQNLLLLSVTDATNPDTNLMSVCSEKYYSWEGMKKSKTTPRLRRKISTSDAKLVEGDCNEPLICIIKHALLARSNEP